MLFFQVRRTFKGHCPANVIVCCVDFGACVAQVAQHIKGWIVQFFLGNAQDFGAELFAQCPLVEHESDVECCAQGAFDFIQFCLAKPIADQACVVDHRRIADCSVTYSIGYDFFDLRAAVAQFCQCGWD